MDNEKLTTKFCPVPEEQQPIKEYEELKDSWLFSWATLSVLAYTRKLLWVGVWGGAISSFLAAGSFSPKSNLVAFILSTILGASILIFLFVIRLYLGWSYIASRLDEKQVFYEESGWYDGQIWVKPPEIIQRDRLILSYQIKPIISRLIKTILILSIIIVMGIIIGLTIA